MDIWQQLRQSNTLLDATKAIGNWGALSLLALSVIGATLIFGLALLSNSAGLISIAWLLSLAVVFFGFNAVGILLMDSARGTPQRSMSQAVLASLRSSHRLLLVALVVGLGVAAWFLAVAVVYFVCKIPFLGPLLLVVAYPLTALVTGLIIFALVYVFMPLTAAAVWSGATTREALVRLVAISRHRLLPVVIQELLLMLLVGVVAFIIGGIVFSGLMAVSPMAALITGALGDMGNLMGTLFGRFFGGGMYGGMGRGIGGGSSGPMMAGALGGGLLLATAWVLPALIALQGICLVYLAAVRGLDMAETESMLERGGEQIAAKKREIQTRLKEEADKRAQARAAAAAAAAVATATPNEAGGTPMGPPGAVYPGAGEPVARTTAPVAVGPSHAAPPAPASVVHCPRCGGQLDHPDDRFCGDCGHDLKSSVA